MNKLVLVLLAAVLVAAVGYKLYTKDAGEPIMRQNVSEDLRSVSSTTSVEETPVNKGVSSITHTITMTDAGYEPSTLSIRRGDSVRFVNQSSGQFWPASGKHPTHEICSQFDPKRALPKGDNYTVKFDETKTCPFHDHLNPAFRGSIMVQ